MLYIFKVDSLRDLVLEVNVPQIFTEGRNVSVLTYIYSNEYRKLQL